MIRSYRSSLPPGVLMILSFLIVIAVGYFLLGLPMMRLAEHSALDLWFTATSATCVTGLSLVPMASFTMLGKGVILLLIQIGGLGLMTLSFSVLSFFLNFGIADRVAASQILDFEYWGSIKNFLTMIVSVTLWCELLGAVALYPVISKYYKPAEALFYSVFYSVSAFCNAGISPHDGGIMAYAHDVRFLIVIAVLVFAGSTGFFVWLDVASFVKRIIAKPALRWAVPAVSLHTRIVFMASSVLIGIATWLFWNFEWTNAFTSFSFTDKILNCLFNAVALRSSGFTTIDYTKATTPVQFLVMLLMFVGGNPVSTASGIKTTTLVLLVATILSTVKARHDVEIFNRTIAPEQIYKALVIVGLSVAWVLASFFVLLMSEGDAFSPFTLFFENISAFSTCGITVGIVGLLSPLGKGVLIVNMIVGRVGILTLLLALAQRRSMRNYKYPHERVLIG